MFQREENEQHPLFASSKTIKFSLHPKIL